MSEGKSTAIALTLFSILVTLWAINDKLSTLILISGN